MMSTMHRIIWTCWLQGREAAPDVVRSCLASWEIENKNWEVRCLDASTVGLYIDIADYIDIKHKTVTSASLSDLIRIALLHEYGGVWVDATTYCTRPLNSWLLEAGNTGFFAFSAPAPDRMLSSWLLSCDVGNRIVAKWASSVSDYWRDRTRSDDYFWFHHLFGDLYSIDREFRAAWDEVPRISAGGPHSVLDHIYEPASTSLSKINWTIPVFKLTHRIDPNRYRSGCLLDAIIHRLDFSTEAKAAWPGSDPRPMRFAGLKVSTENLGDHIQIIAANKLLSRLGVTPTLLLDRDDDLASSPVLDDATEPVGILLNGWFKTNPLEWPPHANLLPLYLGFHIRLFQSPTLVGTEAIENYIENGPIGCRDSYTLSLLIGKGVGAFLSNCLSLLLPRRLDDPVTQTETLVVSRDEKILAYLPELLRQFTFINHYSGSTDFDFNMQQATEILRTYRSRAKLIVTTLLHCALPAIAMGIPVIVFYPLTQESQHSSDLERFSALEGLIRVFHAYEASTVDWRGRVVDASRVKLALLEALRKMVGKWRLPARPILGPIAPPDCLPLPDPGYLDVGVLDPERVKSLYNAKVPDRRRWGNLASYNPAWSERAKLAASLLPDHATIFEIGVGNGALRSLIQDRCHYVGADLQPLEPGTIALDLDADPLPDKKYDYIVLLGVFEYLYWPEAAAKKVCEVTDHVVLSYCCVPSEVDLKMITQARRRRGWVNDFSYEQLVAVLASNGFKLTSNTMFESKGEFDQMIMVFERQHCEPSQG